MWAGGEGWAATGGGKAGTGEGFPASARLPKRHFIWRLVKKIPQSEAGLA